MPSSTPGQHTQSTQNLAKALADNTHHIAKLGNAGDCYRDIQNLIERIEHCINRPTPPRYCGNCPTPYHKTSKTQDIPPTQLCAQPLYAKPDDIETTCWHCKTTYNIQQLIEQQLTNASHMLYTPKEITQILTTIGEPIGDSTWRRWRATGRIKPAGQLYGQDAYRLSDVRRLRAQTHPTQTSSH